MIDEKARFQKSNNPVLFHGSGQNVGGKETNVSLRKKEKLFFWRS